MARQRRHTEPLETLHGVLTSYEEIERQLVDGDWRARAWVFERARASARLETPRDVDVLALHRAMFSHVLPWAGELRKDDRGPGGKVPVAWWDVPVELRKLGDDLRAQVDALAPDPGVPEIASILTNAHHRFQWIHPFRDTNGRTGRVLDAYLLWVTFGLAGPDLASSAIIEPFPTEAAEDDYYEGLQEADARKPERLRRYYEERLIAAFDALARPSDPPARG
jgi:hypothetical protein